MCKCKVKDFSWKSVQTSSQLDLHTLAQPRIYPLQELCAATLPRKPNSRNGRIPNSRTGRILNSRAGRISNSRAGYLIVGLGE